MVLGIDDRAFSREVKGEIDKATADLIRLWNIRCIP